jgi:hypothetical protein
MDDERALFLGFWEQEAKTTRKVFARIPEGSTYKAEWKPPPLPGTMKEVVAA